MKRTLSLEQVAAAKDVSLATARRAVARGELPALKAGNRLVVEESAARAWRSPRPVNPTSPAA